MKNNNKTIIKNNEMKLNGKRNKHHPKIEGWFIVITVLFGLFVLYIAIANIPRLMGG